MSAGAAPDARAQWRRDVRELARPALTYQAWVLLMVAIFDLVVLASAGPSGTAFLVLGVLSGCAVCGVTLGQLMAIGRMRGSFLAFLGLAWHLLSCLVSVPIASLGPIGGVVIAIMFLTPIFVSGGVWSLASSRALFAAWVPLIFGAGAMFTLIESDDNLARWEAGDKWAIWSVGAAAILFLTIALLLVYLVQRERHRLHRWRHAPRALLAGSVEEKGAARPRLTMVGWMTLVAGGLMLTAGTLFIAPYLFRTGPVEGEQHEGGGESQETEPGGADESDGQGSGEGSGGGGGQAERAAQSLAQTICPMLFVLALLAGLAAVIWRPVRRLVVIEYLRTPPFRVSPTTRIAMGWRLIGIGLGDLGIELDACVDASELVDRHAAKLGGIDPELLTRLREAARVRDRIAYGLGLAPGDEASFARAAERVFVLASNRVAPMKEAQNVFRDVG